MTGLDAALREIAAYNGRPVRIMEVCGTHTAAIRRSGIRSLLPEGVRLLSGPGCPVCVTPVSAIDRLVALSLEKGVCVLCFGDMFRVPGTNGSLAEARARGGDVRMIYAPLEAQALAKAEPDTLFAVAAVGFETTAPAFALLAEKILAGNIGNLRLVTALKAVIPAVDHVLSGPCRADALICPGHVGTVIGAEPFAALCQKHGKPFVVSGFEDAHVVAAVAALLRMLREGRAETVNLYPEAVHPAGNEKALEKLGEYFEICDSVWRGLGVIPASGYRLRGSAARLELGFDDGGETSDCLCGQILSGILSPPECPLFAGECTPARPVGPCMVSGEGACGIWYLDRKEGPA